jgi:hypothetical protein
MRHAIRLFWTLLFYGIALFLSFQIINAQAPGDIQATIESNESLRSLAKEYLGESNDWEILLYYNGLKSTDELKTGQRLWIPVRQYKELTRSIDDCQNTIVAANAQGAGVLAPLKIEKAIVDLNGSIRLKKEGNLASAQKAADQALAEAKSALAETKEKRMQSITAVLAEKRGTVQYRQNDALNWKDAALKQELIEQDRLRTLSRSFGNVLFVDGNRVHMDENALIVIETVKKDMIQNLSSVELVVMEGDVSTLIQSLHTDNRFRVTSPGVNTDIRSRSFLTSRDKEKTTRFSNYDGQLDVVSRGEKVTLATNEGTKVAYGKKPDIPKKLLEPPNPVHPQEGQSLVDNNLSFRWDPVKNAFLYRIEISRNKSFMEIEKIIKIDIGETAFWEAPQNGIYYWRIGAVDKEQLQGPYSKPIGFSVHVDRTPPYLVVTSPAADTIVFDASMEIRGKTEDGTTVMINQNAVRLSGQGDFQYILGLKEGKQSVVVAAKDSAGNQSQIVREIVSNSGPDLFTLSCGDTLFSNAIRMTINGRVKPMVLLTINSHPVETHESFFSHPLVLEEGQHEIAVTASSPDGKIQRKKIDIMVDTTPPGIQINEIPSFTERPSIRLEGVLSETAQLTLNRQPVEVRQGRFSYTVDLREGENVFSMQLKDRAGNVAEKSYTVVRDSEPPKGVSYELSANRVKGGEIVNLRVKALDSGVGLARTCTYTAEIVPGDAQLSGLLKLSRESNVYEGSMVIPPEKSGTLMIKKIFVSDYLGNTSDVP